jgi:hypothetical protein
LLDRPRALRDVQGCPPLDSPREYCASEGVTIGSPPQGFEHVTNATGCDRFACGPVLPIVYGGLELAELVGACVWVVPSVEHVLASE